MCWYKKRPGANLWLVILLLVITVPFYLIGISFGLPNNQFGDEWAILNSVLMLPYRYGDPRLYFYGVPFIYLYGLVVGLIYAAYHLVGAVGSPEEFAVSFLQDPTHLVMAGRLLSAGFASATVATLYFLGRRFLPPLEAVLVTLVFALGGVVISYAHYAKLDQMLVFLYVLSVYLMVTGRDSHRRWIAAVVLAGVALATKLSAISLTVPILVMAVYDCGGWRHAWKSRRFWLTPVWWVLGFALANPWAIIRLVQGLVTGAGASLLLGSMDQHFGGESFKGTRLDNVGFYLRVLYLHHGVAGALLAACSPLLLWLRRDRAAVILLAAGWAMVPLVILPPRNDVHWLMPATPALLLGGFVVFYEVMARWQKVRPWAWIVVGAATIVPQVVAGVGTVQRFSLPRTMDVAKDWIETHVPAETPIAMDSGRYLPTNAPALRQHPDRIDEVMVEEAGLRLDVASGGKVDHFYRLLKKANVTGVTYRIYAIQHGILWKGAQLFQRNSLKSLEEYRRLGVRHLVLSDVYWKRYFLVADRLSECQDHAATYLRFIRDEVPELPILARFPPVPGESVGPTITVYGIPE